ncbi:hypothetical protein Ddc_11594 [Ditylenchus destructor]|nr:hypothetical protein Ddc_11594 [Ditylenchus destructor]
MDRHPTASFDIFTLRNVFQFLKRKSLCRLRNVNQQFNHIIESEFSETPYLLLPGIEYCNDKWWWATDGMFLKRMPLEVLAQLPTSKFVRFSELNLYVNENLPLTDLSSMGHIWENKRVEISWPDDLVPSAEFADVLAKCKHLDGSKQYSNASLSILRGLITGNCRTLRLMDNCFSPTTSEIPWSGIMDFMFRPAEKSYGFSHIMSLKTQELPNHEECLAFVEAVKKKFICVAIDLSFLFYWNAYSFHDGTIPFAYDDFCVQNLKTDQYLTFKCLGIGFELRV